MSISRFFKGLLDRIFVVAGAFLGSQVPTLMQQYSQRLAGHIDELQYQISAWHKMSVLAGKSLNEYINKFANHADVDFARHGEHMQSMIARYNELSHSQQLLNESSIWTRPFVFISTINWEIFQSSLHSFVPQMTLTVEGLYYTILGLIFGYLSYQVLIRLFRVGMAGIRKARS